MKMKFRLSKPVLCFQALHTATVALFVYVMVKSGAPPLLLAVSAAVFLAFITAYTARKVSLLVAGEIAESLKAVSLVSVCLKSLSEEMNRRAKELERCAGRVMAFANSAEDLLEKVNNADGESPGVPGSGQVTDISEHKSE